MEFGAQSLIESTFPKAVERFHVEMRQDRVKITPLPNSAFRIIKRFKDAGPYLAFVALTGGVDIHAMERLGWRADVVLENRPVEARDIASGPNLSEVHALNTWVNGKPQTILNEDIHTLDIDRMRRLLVEVPAIGRRSFKTLWMQAKCDSKVPKNPTSLPRFAKQAADAQTFTDDFYGIVYTPQGIFVTGSSSSDTLEFHSMIKDAMRCHYGDKSVRTLMNSLNRKHIFEIRLSED